MDSLCPVFFVFLVFLPLLCHRFRQQGDTRVNLDCARVIASSVLRTIGSAYGLGTGACVGISYAFLWLADLGGH